MRCSEDEVRTFFGACLRLDRHIDDAASMMSKKKSAFALKLAKLIVDQPGRSAISPLTMSPAANCACIFIVPDPEK